MEALNTFTELLRFNAGYLATTLEKIPDQNFFVRPERRGNPLIWLLGHVVVNRAEIVEILGGNPDVGNLLDLFARGTKPENNPSLYPRPQQLLSRFIKLANTTDSVLKGCDPNILDQKSWGKFKSLGQNLAFSYMHETHHIGQIVYLVNLPGIKPDKRSGTNFKRMDPKNSTAKLILDNIKSVFA